MKPQSKTGSDARRLKAPTRRKQLIATKPPTSLPELQRLLHELQVHQVELQLQNEELVTTRAELEAASARYAELYDFAPTGFLTFDSSGVIRMVNLAGARLLGTERSRLVKRRLGQFVATSHRPAFGSFLHRVFIVSEETQSCELLLQRKGVSSLAVQIEATRSADGQECRAAMLDITTRKQAEETLRQSEHRYRALFELTAVGVAQLALDGRWLDVNPRLCEIVGYSREELLARTSHAITHPDDLAADLSLLRRLLAGEVASYSMEKRYLRKDQTFVWVNLTVSLVREPSGAARYFTSVVVDITKRKQAELALQQSEQEFRTLAESVPQLVWATRPDGWNNFINNNWLEYTGLTAAESSGHGWHIAVHPEDKRRSWEAWQNATRTGSTYSLEIRLRRADGAFRWWLVRGMPQRDAAGNIRKWFGTCTDIHELKLAQQAVAASEAKYRQLHESLMDAFCSVDMAGHLQEWNSVFQALIGYPAEEISRLTYQEITPEKWQAGEAQIIKEQVLTRGYSDVYEKEYRRKDGTILPVELRTVLLRDRLGQPSGMWAVIREITKRKQAQHSLRQANRLYATLVQIGQTVVRVKGREELFEGICRNLIEFGQFRMAWIGLLDGQSGQMTPVCHAGHEDGYLQKITIHISPETPLGGGPSAVAIQQNEVFINNDTQFTPEMSPWRDEALRRGYLSSAAVPFHLKGVTIGALNLYAGEPGFFSAEEQGLLKQIGKDISYALDSLAAQAERRLADEQLRKLARAVEQSPVAIVITDTAGRIEFVNPKFTQVSGYSSEELMGKNPRILKSGETRPEEYRRMWATLKAGKEWRGEFHNRRKDGKLFWESALISPVIDEAGKVTHYIAVKEDTTEKKQLEANFLRTQRLESIGALAGGIAHDLNNILAPILMLAPLIREAVADADTRAMLDSVANSAQRGADIVKQLLTFARGQSGVRAPLPVGHLIRDMGKIVRETFPRDIRPIINTPSDIWPLLGDATQLHQALLNLCVNARDAMPDGGTLTIETRNVTVDPAFAATLSEVHPGQYVCVRVADTGVGIAPENLDRIFDPFFTTKEIGKGTGLGLATVLGIVRGHEGFVRVSSRPGEGTTFELYFPALPELLASPTPPARAPRPRGQGELILVVDDEPEVGASLRRTLVSHGYRVVTASQGVEALDVFSKHRAEVRAVITDMMMPVMNGPALIHALRALAPQLLILGMTGLPEKKGLKDLETLELSVLLVKPFSRDELLTALQDRLRPSRTALAQQGTA